MAADVFRSNLARERAEEHPAIRADALLARRQQFLDRGEVRRLVLAAVRQRGRRDEPDVAQPALGHLVDVPAEVGDAAVPEFRRKHVRSLTKATCKNAASRDLESAETVPA